MLSRTYFFVCLLTVFFLSNGFAQLSAESKLTVSLSDVKSIKIDQTLLQGLASENNNKVSQFLEVTSSSEYEIKVYWSASIENKDLTSENVVRIIPQHTDAYYSNELFIFTEVDLAEVEQSIIKSVSGGASKTFNIFYQASDWEDVCSSGEHCDTIIYSIVSN